MNEIKWLQDRIFKLSSENISQFQEEILCSNHVSSIESITNLSHNIILATQTRCLQLPLYADLVIFLISRKEKTEEDPIFQLIPELFNFCFKHSNLNKEFEPFLKCNGFCYNQFYFLYLLFRKISENQQSNSIFSNFDLHYMINNFYEQYLKYNQYLPFEVMQMFLPEIEQNDFNLFFSLMKKKTNSQTDLKSIIQIRDNFFCNSEILQSIQNDDVDKFQQISLNTNISKQIDLWNFYPFRTKEFSYPINLSAFFGSIKCFKYILLNDNFDKSLVNDELMRDAVLGGNVEIIRIIEQRFGYKINEELINYTIIAHQNEIAQWMIDNKEDIKLSLFIESCLYSNNIEMLDSILYSIPDSEKSIIFNDKKKCMALENCASLGFFEIIQYLFDNEFVNSWKNKQSVFMKILLKAAEKSSVEFIDYLYQNNLNEFNKYIMNYTELLNASAKSGKKEVFDYALKLFKKQKKRPKSNKKILGKSIIGKNIEIFQKCYKLFPNDLNEMYKNQFSLISLSIIKNQRNIFDFLLSLTKSSNDQKLDINQNFKGKTPLFYSLLYRRKEMAIELLNYDDIDVNSNFPIMNAIKFGFFDVVKKMCQNKNININDVFTPDGTPLLLSIEKKDIESFKLLLSIKNIDVNVSSSSLPTPIMKAIETCQDNPEFQNSLFSIENIDLNINNKEYFDIMQLAINSGNALAIKELNKRKFKLSKLDYPFEINKESIDAICQCQNFSPSFFKVGYLNYFIEQKYFDVAKFCLSFEDCDVNSCEPIISAMNQGNEEVASLIAKKPNFKVKEEIVIDAIIHHFDNCLEILLDHDDFELDVSYINEKPLYIASKKGTPKSIKTIIQKYKNKINVQEIKSTKISPEKDTQMLDILKEIFH